MRTNERLSAVDHRRLALFGAELQRRRLEVGLSQTELGTIADVGWTRVRNWEQGLRRPTRSSVERLASALFLVKRFQVGLPVERYGWLPDEWEDIHEILFALLGTTVGDAFEDDGRKHFYNPDNPGSLIDDIETQDDYDRERRVYDGMRDRAREWVRRNPKKGRR